jgi:hypothetical protein
VEKEADVEEEGQQLSYLREFHSMISNKEGYFDLEQFSQDEDLQPIYVTKDIIS